MQIDHEQLDRSVLKINLSGRMDVAGIQQIDGRLAELIAAPSNAIIVDLLKVDFITSVGIRTLLIHAKALRARGGRMVLLNPDANVARVLGISGVDTIISVFRDLDAACAAVAAEPSGNA